jgi:NADH:ubiquinone oxidoreductase subunit 2 (subunit N)
VGVALVGVVISLYYYFSIVRGIYWSRPSEALKPLSLSQPIRCVLWACLAGMLVLGLFPDVLLNGLVPVVAVFKP